MRQTELSKKDLLIVYPEPGHETFEENTFVMGNAVLPNGTIATSIRINGIPVPLTKQGNFSGIVPLHTGTNILLIEALDANNRILASHTLTVIHPLPYEILPADPPVILQETAFPGGYCALMPGDYLGVGFYGSPDAKAFVDIPGLFKTPVPLINAYTATPENPVLDQRQGVFGQLQTQTRPFPSAGYYQGRLQIPSGITDEKKALPILFRLLRPTGQAEYRAGTLDVWLTPRAAVLKSPESATDKTGDTEIVFRTAPSSNASRLTPQHPDEEVMVIGILQEKLKQGVEGDDAKGWGRIQFCAQPLKTGWTLLKNIGFQSGMPTPNPSVRLIHVASPQENRATIQIPLPKRMPFEIEAGQNDLLLTLYNVENHCDIIDFKPDSGGVIPPWIQQITIIPSDDNNFRLKIHVNALTGYDTRYEKDGLLLTLKTLPLNIDETVILIDPGHGGAEQGSIGPSGIPEKAMNLAVSLILKEELRKAGFQHLYLTRISDLDMPLTDRERMARQLQADLIISVHHNALPDGRDPLQNTGLSTYYYHAFSEPLARFLLESLTTHLPTRNYGLFYDSLLITRIHTGLAVLVELGFFTNPEEYERLISPACQQREAQCLAEAITQYLRHPD